MATYMITRQFNKVSEYKDRYLPFIKGEGQNVFAVFLFFFKINSKN